MSGIINAAKPHQKVLGFPSLKGDFLSKDIAKFVTKNNPWELITSYHFGGYGKISEPLLMFLNDFYQIHKIPLDPIYTGKMVFGVMDLIRNNYFPSNSKILLIHTGGLQGIEGMNLKLKKKNIQTIHYND
jgi:1-aminocyclopropane-1-carboxylate deaminase